jgi:septum formation protein
MKLRIILASASPRRRKLLRELGLKFHTVPTSVRERVSKGLSARRVAERNALRKAQAAARKVKGLIISADTIVATRFGIVGKPRNKRDAVCILSRLSGTRHRVITGLCLLDTCTGRKKVASEVTWVKMRKMSPEEIQAYVDSGEAMGKAGAYAIQETADRYVEKVEGSFSNVVGLPIELLYRMLRHFGVSL